LTEQKSTLILGIGNILLRDEGAGIHVIEKLKEDGFDSADLVDGGTGGFHLLGFFGTYRKIIIVDASLDEYPAGHVRVLYPKYAIDFPVQLSAHEIGLRDLIESAYLLGNLPEICLITISVKDFREMGVELSSEVSNAIPIVAEKVRELVVSG
jgi:hydrogenase maturation protease